jgi:hypothetical protein
MNRVSLSPKSSSPYDPSIHEAEKSGNTSIFIEPSAFWIFAEYHRGLKQSLYSHERRSCTFHSLGTRYVAATRPVPSRSRTSCFTHVTMPPEEAAVGSFPAGVESFRALQPPTNTRRVVKFSSESIRSPVKNQVAGSLRCNPQVQHFASTVRSDCDPSCISKNPALPSFTSFNGSHPSSMEDK